MSVESASTLVDLFKTDLSKRHPIDGLTDFYHRGFMVKVLVFAIAIILVKQQNDSLSCIIPKGIEVMDCHDGSCPKFDNFCWSLGVYVYEELMDRVEDGAPYFALPKRIEFDGLRNGNTSDQCSTVNSSVGCIKMTKLLLYQYQYIYFYPIVLILFFVVTYIMYTQVNSELVDLYKLTIEKEEDDKKIREHKADLIIDRFMCNRRICEIEGLPWYKRIYSKMVFNICIKVIYIMIYPIALTMYDITHNTRTKDSGWRVLHYGSNWFTYKRNKMAAKQAGYHTANPRDQLFPPFGICDVTTFGYDVTSNVQVNKELKFVCEISPHGLYTFMFLFLWVLCIVGLVLAIAGCVYYIWYFVRLAWGSIQDKDLRKIWEDKKRIERFRTKYYLDYIKKTNIVMYREVELRLKDKSDDNVDENDDDVELGLLKQAS